MRQDTQVSDDGSTSGYVQFWTAGESVKGEFHCSECGYGVAIFRVLPRSEQMTAERQQAGLVARKEHLERCRVAATDERDQALVGLQPEQGRAPVKSETAGISEC